jgi:3-oxosteroid 1-dehydrogenase
MRWDSEYDFISLGGGIGGLAGAIAGAEFGLQVAVLEKSEWLGGVAAYSGGQVWVPGNWLEEQLGIQDSPEAGISYLLAVGAGQAREALTRTLLTSAPEVVRFFADRAGLRWQVIRGLPDYYYPDLPESRSEGRYLEVEPFPATTLGQWQARTRTPAGSPMYLTNQEMFDAGGRMNFGDADRDRLAGRKLRDERCQGAGLMSYLIKAAMDKGVELFASANTTELVVEEGRVTGLVASIDGGSKRIGARRGVLFATSGYDWDPGFVEAFEQFPDFVSKAPASVTGDHLRLVLPLGGKTARVAKPVVLAYADGTQWEGQAVWRTFPSALPHAIVVNRKGRRFTDDSFYPALSHAISVIDGSRQETPNYPCWAVFDQGFIDRYGLGGVNFDDGLPAECVKAATLGELGKSAGIDPGGLEAEVAAFNDNAVEGVDPAFGRGERPWTRAMYGDRESANPTLGPVDRAPYYALRLRAAGLALASTGLLGNGDGRVLDQRDQPIPGLYVAGNSMALVDVGAGYQSGVGNVRGLTYGYRAARHAAGAQLE